ncbi:MAG: hypothetical protein JW934_08095 [Anaerolineae bacterium]|nr:hypothetical protein [Anaerolineae bacterium]
MTIITRSNYHLFCQEPRLTPDEQRIELEMQRAIADQMKRRDLTLWQVIVDATRVENAEDQAACRRVTDDPADLAAECDAQVWLKRARIRVYLAAVNVPRCWCGAPMKPVGIGAYPYDCAAKDKHPHDMVYAGCDNGHTGWTHESAVTAAT